MSTSFPSETSAYRTARNNLLTTEIELRKQLETIAALRRELPIGGAIPEDYVFDENAYHGEFAPREAGQDARHVDMIWPLWSLIDLTPEGRAKTWRPKLKYE